MAHWNSNQKQPRKITGADILDASLDAADLPTAVAGDGISYTAGVLDLDLNELTAAVVDVAADSIAIIDADDSNDNKKESIADLVGATAGAGLTATSGVLAVVNATNGGLSVGANDVKIDINDLAAAAVDVAADSIAIYDSDGAVTAKESIADLATGMAGNGIAATSGVLAVNPDSTTGANTQPVTVAANGVGLDINAIAGTGIEADGSANLRLAAQGNGIAGGAGSTLSVNAATNGGIAVAAGGVSMDLSDLAAAAVDVSADSIAIYDSDGATTALESIADLAGQMAGTNITASAGTLGVTASSLDAEEAAEVANVNAVGGLIVGYRTTVPSGANADTDITITYKTRVIMAFAHLKGAGTAGSTLTLKNSTNAITNAADTSGVSDNGIVQFTSIDDAYMDIADAGTLRWSSASSGADFPGAECYVIGLRVA